MVEATSVRCQAVLEAMRGRFDQARELVARARATVEELGMRHGILETDMFAGVIELFADDAVAAEPFLRRAYQGLGILGVGADAGQAAALLSRALLAQDRVAEAAELADESARLAGQNLQTAIASKAAQAEIASAEGRHAEAIELAEAAVAIAATTDLTIDHARAVSTLATILDLAGAGAAVDQHTAAARLYEAKGARVDPRPPLRVAFPPTAESGSDPTTRSGRRSTSHDHPTLATRVNERGRRLLDEQRWEELEALLAPDFRGTSRRSGLGNLDFDGSTFIETVRGLPETFSSGGAEVIATRDDTFALSRWTWADGDDFTLGFLNVLEVTDDGLLKRCAVFDVEDLPDALIELDRLWLEDQPEEISRTIELAERYRSGFPDPDAVDELVTGDFEFVDHRAMTAWRWNSADWREIQVDNPDARLEVDSILISTYHRLLPGAWLAQSIMRARSATDLELEVEAIHLQIQRIDRIARIEIFDVDQIEAAFARFDELTTPSTGNQIRNRASDIGLRLVDELAAGSESMDAYRHPEVVVEDRRHLHKRDYRTDDIESALQEPHRAGRRITVTATDVIAVREDHLALIDYSYGRSDWTSRLLSVVDLGDDDRVVREVVFDPEDLVDALDLLDDWYAEQLDPGRAAVVEMSRAGAMAFCARDSERLRSTYTADAVIVDRRKGVQNFDAIGVTEWVERSAAIWDVEPTIVSLSTSFVRLTPAGSVVTGGMWDTAGNRWDLCSIALTRDGRASRQEFFDIDDLDHAIARFEELTSTPELTIAEQTQVALLAALNRGDREAVAKLAAEDATFIGRRPLGLPAMTASDMNQTAFDFDLPGAQWRSEIVATRGEHLCLTRGEYGVGDDLAFEVLILFEVDDSGVQQRIASFEPAQLAEASVLLDEWYLESLPGAEAAVYHPNLALSRAYSEHDADAMRRFYAPDAVIADHRAGPQNFGEIGRDDWVSRSQAIWSVTPNITAFVTKVHGINPAGLLVEGGMRDGEGNRWDLLALNSVRDGRIQRNEYFDPGQLDVALARFDELTRDRRSALENRASQVILRLVGSFPEADPEVRAALRRPDSVLEDRRHLRQTSHVGTDDIEEMANRSLTELPLTSPRAEVLAVRGDHHCLIKSEADRGDWETAIIATVEIDRDGLLQREVLFDPEDLPQAYELLDEWYLQSLPPSEAATFAVLLAARAEWPNRDHEDDPYLRPSLIAVDHRLGGFGQIDRSEWLERQRSFVDVAPGIGNILHRVPNVSADGVLTDYSIVDPAGNEWRFWAVYRIREGMVERVDLFDPDDWSTAASTFENLSESSVHPSTLAERVEQDWIAAVNDERWDDLRAVLTDDFASHSHRSGAGNMVLTGEGYLDGCADARATFGRGTVTSIATRGEKLLLSRAVWEPDATWTFEFLQVTETTADGLRRRQDTFDIDDETTAFALLDEWYAEALRGDERVTFETAHRAWSAYSRHDAPAMKECFTAGAEFVDRRTGVQNFGTIDVDGWVERSEAVWRVQPTTWADTTAIIAHNARGLVMVGGMRDADGNRWDLLALTIIDNGLVTRSEFFDPADLEAAVARFEELTAPPTGPRRNPATEAYEAWFGALNRGAHDELHGFFSTDFRSADHRSMGNPTGTASEIIDALRSRVEFGTRFEQETVALRGDRLGLFTFVMTAENDFESTTYAVVRVDDDGLIDRAIFHPEDQLDDAFESLDQLFTESLDGRQRRTFALAREGWRVWEANDFEQMAALHSPNYVVVDHRVGGFGTVDRTGGLDRQRSFFEIAPTVRPRNRDVPAISESGLIMDTHLCDADGNEWRFWFLQVIRGGLQEQGEFFSPDDLDAALARFEELTAERHDLSNLAVESERLFVELGNAGRWGEVLELHAPEFRGESSRSVALGTRYGREGPVETVRQFVEELGQQRMAPVAIRGNRLSLCRFETGNDDEWSIASLSLIETDDQGRRVRQHTFDGSDLVAAMRKLGDWWVEGEGAAHAEFLEWAVRLGEVLREEQSERLRESVTDSFRLIDHRELGFGELTIDAYLESLPQLHERGDWVIVARRFLRLTEDVLLWDVASMVTSGESLELDSLRLVLIQMEGELVNRMEWFDIDDMDVALARFDELGHDDVPAGTSSEPGLAGGAPVTTSVRVHDEHSLASNQGRLEVLAELLAPDFGAQSLRTGLGGMTFDRDMYISGAREALAGFGQITTETVATRGDRISLHRYATPDSSTIAFGYLHLQRLDEHDRIHWVLTFDLDNEGGAFEALENWYADSLPPDLRTVHRALRESVVVEDDTNPELAARLYREDFSFVDHRTLGMGSLDRDGWIDRLHAFREVAPDRRMRILHIPRVSRDGAVSIATGTDEGGFEWTLVGVSRIADGRIARSEFFDPDDLATALDRFEKLDTPPPSRLSNRASEAVTAGNARLVAQDSEGVIATFHDDAIIEDLRPLLAASSTKAGVRQVVEDTIANAPVMNAQVETLATREEMIALTSTAYHWTTDDYMVERLDVTKVDGDGRVLRQATYNLDQLDNAIARLDEWYGESLDARLRPGWEVVVRSIRAEAARDLALAREVYSPDLVAVDHRATGMGQVDLEGRLALMESAKEITPDRTTMLTRVHANAEVTSVLEIRIETTDEFSWSILAVGQLDGGVVVRQDFYDVDELDAALARFEELTRPTNQASELGIRFWDLVFDQRDIDAAIALTARNAVSTDRRRLVRSPELTMSGVRDYLELLLAHVPAETPHTLAVVAVAGDQRALVRLTADDPSSDWANELLQLVELDADGLIAHVTSYSPEDEAEARAALHPNRDL